MTAVAAGYRNNSRQEEENYSVLIQSLCRPSDSARLEDLWQWSWTYLCL